MGKFSHFVDLLFTRKFISKFIAYFILVIFFYLFSDFLGIFLLTFIFGYLFLSLAEFLKKHLDHFVNTKVHKIKIKKMLKKVLCINFLIVFIYIGFIGIIYFILSDILPKLIQELSELPRNIPFLTEQISGITNVLVEIKNFKSEIGGSINEVMSTQDKDVIMDVLSKLKSVSVIFLQIVLSFILSFVFLIDRFRLKEYLLGIKKSSFNFLYKEYKIILNKIVVSFGLILKAQSIIALVNGILTIIGLFIIGLIHGITFPYLLTLGLIVFIAGFVPVLGVFISSIPILIIAYSIIGGYAVLVEIMLLIIFVHLIEAYYLNPKIISKFLEIPVSLTFIILIISEHVFGIAGLIIGISLFYFVVGILRDINNVLIEKKVHIKKG